MTEEEIQHGVDVLINVIPEEDRTRRQVQGGIMKSLKEKYGNTIDMGFAAKYVGTKLN